MSDPPSLNLQPCPSTSHLTITAQTYLSQDQSEHACKLIATGAIVFSASRILLLQRAPGDSMPNRWETPGGACDKDDQTILHAVARELWEETMLVARSVGPMVGEGYTFKTRSGKMVRKLNFIVEVERRDGDGDGDGNGNGNGGSDLEVRLRPEEHQGFVWATEEEVRACKVGDVEIGFTMPGQKAVVLDAFAVLKASSAA
jgi:8-oxo-dGTP pyrophosphatase MutT (NUDIX family)